MQLTYAIKKYAFTAALGALVPSFILLKLSERNMIRQLPQACNKILDDEFFLTAARIHPHLECMGALGRALYLDYYAFDLVLFPIIYTTVLAGATTRLWPRSPWLLALPLLTVIADVMENVSLTYLLSTFPARHLALEQGVSAFTALKLLFLVASISVIAIGGLSSVATSGVKIPVKDRGNCVFAASLGALPPSFVLLNMFQQSMHRVLPPACSTLLDADFFLSADKIHRHFECMGESGRALHLEFYLFDLVVFPVIYLTALSGTLTRLWPEIRGVWAAPLCAALIDIVENAGMCVLLTQFPARFLWLEAGVSFLTRAKWAAVLASVVLVISGCVLRSTTRRTEHRGKKEE